MSRMAAECPRRGFLATAAALCCAHRLAPPAPGGTLSVTQVHARAPRRSTVIVVMLMLMLAAWLGAAGAVLPTPASSASASTVGDAIVSAARGQAGVQSNPRGTECNPYSAYWGSGSACANGNRNVAWCADFAAWAWAQAGITGLYGHDINANASSFRTWGQSNGRWHPIGDGYVPQPGDAAEYSDAHVGIYTGGPATSPTVINGNWYYPDTGNGQVYEQANQKSNGAGAALSGYTTAPDGQGGGGGQIADGSFVRTPDGNIFRIAGGAPLHLASCGPFNGCAGLISVPDLSRFAARPRDGVTISTPSSDTGRIYKIAGGAPLYLNSCSADCGTPVQVNQWTIDNLDHLNAVPSNGTTLATPLSEAGRIYKVAGGAPLYLNSCDADCGAPVTVNQYTIDSLDHLRAYPDDSTTLATPISETGRIYKVAGGVPLYLTSCSVDCGGPVTVNQGTIDNDGHLRRTIADGTFVRVGDGPSNGLIARAAGSALLGLSSCAPFAGSCGHPVNINQSSFDSYASGHADITDGAFVRVADGPSAGTIARAVGGALLGLSTCDSFPGGCAGFVEVNAYSFDTYARTHPTPRSGSVATALPSGQQWRFSSGCRDATAGAPSSVQVNDASVAGITPCDRTNPTVTLAALPVFSLGTLSVRYSGQDAASGVASFDVRYRRAAYNGGFAALTYPSTWQHTISQRVSLSAVRGSTSCFSVRARDKAGNLSGWSSERCTAVALDDRALSASTGWTRATGSAYYAGTTTSAAQTGGVLTRTGIQARRLSLLATRCPGCGTVGVYWNGTLIRKISLSSTTTAYKQMITITDFGAVRLGTITIKTLTSASTRIDGLGTSRV